MSVDSDALRAAMLRVLNESTLEHVRPQSACDYGKSQQLGVRMDAGDSRVAEVRFNCESFRTRIVYGDGGKAGSAGFLADVKSLRREFSRLVSEQITAE